MRGRQARHRAGYPAGDQRRRREAEVRLPAEGIPPNRGRNGRLSAVRVRGLVTVPPIGRKKGDKCRYFQKIRRIAVDINAQKYDNIFMDFLSMGMTDDFEDAIACGSTMVRIGTAIFGPRNYAPVKSD